MSGTRSQRKNHGVESEETRGRKLWFSVPLSLKKPYTLSIIYTYNALFCFTCSSEAKQILTTKKVMFSKFEKMH